jgi:hypothetical protein
MFWLKKALTSLIVIETVKGVDVLVVLFVVFGFQEMS